MARSTLESVQKLISLSTLVVRPEVGSLRFVLVDFRILNNQAMPLGATNAKRSMMRLLELAGVTASIHGMSNSRIHWIRILLGGLFAEVALIIAIVPLGLHIGGDFLLYTAPPGSLLTCFLAALWVGRRIESRFILHGTLVGVVAALIYLALTRAQPEPFAYIVAHALKLAGGALGGFVAQRRQSPSLQRG